MILIICLLFVSLPELSQGAIPIRKLPFNEFLLQEPPFQVEENTEDSTSLPSITTVPLVMRILFEEAERVNSRDLVPQNGDFQPLARSIQPLNVGELGLQRVTMDFPPLSDEMKPGAEAWLVFQLRQSHILGNNCTQVLTVYENDKSKRPVLTVPLNYKNDDPLLMVNITKSLRGWRRGRPSYVVLIKDSTSYTRDQHLYSFANYIDCSLARACEVLELHDLHSNPVLLVVSPEFAAKKIMESQGARGRVRRSSDSTQGLSVEMKDMHGVADKSCRFEEWVVNVEQLGWDWLVYPERIPLNLCVGKCPVLLDRHFNATSHAVARGLHRLVLGQESKPDNVQPCCVPVKYRRFTMLIEKSPGIVSLETSADLSAAQCGCR